MDIRPRILMDMDGPLAAFDDHYFRRNEENGWPMEVTVENQTLRFASGHVIDKEHRRLATAMVNSPGWFRELPVTPGAQKGMAELAQVADVWIVTKPLEANPTCRDDKAVWLEQHFGIGWIDKLILTPDKSLILGDLLVDDAPKPEWYDHATWDPVIFTKPYNGEGTKWAGPPRWTWADGIDALMAHADANRPWELV
jgi:5'-nucleotidase